MRCLSCSDCMYAYPANSSGNGVINVCRRTRRVLCKNLAPHCEYYNNSVCDSDVCYKCKHYLGGNDWGLSCAKQYNVIVHSLDDACDLYEAKE